MIMERNKKIADLEKVAETYSKACVEAETRGMMTAINSLDDVLSATFSQGSIDKIKEKLKKRLMGGVQSCAQK